MTDGHDALLLVREYKTLLRSQASRTALSTSLPTEYPREPLQFKDKHPLIWASVFKDGAPVANDRFSDEDWRLRASQVPCRSTRSGCKMATPATRSRDQRATGSDAMSMLCKMLIQSQATPSNPGLNLTMFPRRSQSVSGDRVHAPLALDDSVSTMHSLPLVPFAAGPGPDMRLQLMPPAPSSVFREFASPPEVAKSACPSSLGSTDTLSGTDQRPEGALQLATTPAHQKRSLAELIGAVQSHVHGNASDRKPPKHCLKRPAAAKAKAKAAPKAKAKAPMQITVLGCSKCRWSKSGCGRCKALLV